MFSPFAFTWQDTTKMWHSNKKLWPMFLKSDWVNQFNQFNWEPGYLLIRVAQKTNNAVSLVWTGQNRPNQPKMWANNFGEIHFVGLLFAGPFMFSGFWMVWAFCLLVSGRFWAGLVIFVWWFLGKWLRLVGPFCLLVSKPACLGEKIVVSCFHS